MSRAAPFCCRRALAILALLSAAVFARAAGESKVSDRGTTESLRAAILGDDRAAADRWVELNTYAVLEQWEDLAIAAQQLVNRRPTVLIADLDDRSLYRPLRRLLADFMTSQPALLEAYRRNHAPDARSYLAEFRRTHRLDALEQLLERLPFVAERAEALRLAADGYLDRREFERAAAMFAALRAVADTAEREQRAVRACKEVSCWVDGECPETAMRRLREIRREFGGLTVEVGDDSLNVDEFCNRLEKEITNWRKGAGDSQIGLERLRAARGWVSSLEPRPLTAAFRRKHPARVPSYVPTIQDRVVYISDGNELRAIEAPGGGERWRWFPPRPDRFNVEGTHKWLDRLAPTVLRPAVTERHVLFLRPLELAETVHSVCCLNRANGRRVWQRVAWSDEPEAPETAPVTRGDWAWVVVSTMASEAGDRAAVDRRAVVCFRVETGEQIWRTPLPRPRRQAGTIRPGSVARPIVGETHVLVLEDRGIAYCLERATGKIQWARAMKTAAEDTKAPPASGRCVIADDRVCLAAAGSSHVECADLASGERLWAKPVNGPIRGLAADGQRLFVTGEGVQALALRDGAPVWTPDSMPPAVDGGCVAGKFLLVPTEEALFVFETANGRLADRLDWPHERPMTDLAASGDALVGMIDDTLCKFGKLPGGPGRTQALQGEAEEELMLPPRDLAAAFFADARIAERKDEALPLPTIGRSASPSPAHWVVHDAAAETLRCFAAEQPNTPAWQVPFSGHVRWIAFDDRFVCIRCADRLELRDLSSGAQLFSTPMTKEADPRFAEGRVLWTEQRRDDGRDRTFVVGYDAAKRRKVQAPLADLDLRELHAYLWDDERMYLVGDNAANRREFVVCRLDGDRPVVEKREAADNRIRSVKPGRDPWLAFDGKLCVYVHETQAIYCYNLRDGRRIWKCQLDRNKRPLDFWRRAGRYLLWCRGSEKEKVDSYIGITDLRNGERIRRVPASEAAVHNDHLCALWGVSVRAYNIPQGSALGEVEHAIPSSRPVWIQAFADRMIVGLADEGDRIAKAMAYAPDLDGRRPPDRRDHSRRTTEVRYHNRPMEIDGWTDDWDHVATAWSDLESWRPVLDRQGKPVVGTRSGGDLAAQWRACYDDAALYFLIRVRDDFVVPPRWSDCPGVADSIELALTGESFARNLPTFSLGLDTPGTCWAAGPRLGPDQAQVRYDPRERWTLYEMKLPWPWLAEMGIRRQQPENHRGYYELSFALVVNDDDGDGPEGSLEWGAGLADSWNPSDWRVLRFRMVR